MAKLFMLKVQSLYTVYTQTTISTLTERTNIVNFFPPLKYFFVPLKIDRLASEMCGSEESSPP